MKNPAEREIIRIFAKEFDRKHVLPLGFDDDVSAVPLTSQLWLIVKTDMLVASTDIPRGMTDQEAARKAVVATVSDFAAKGVQPRALMVSIGLPRPAPAAKIRQIALGLDQASREYNCKIIGGDTNEAECLVIDVAGVGTVSPQKLVRRNGARPGDVVAVTGPFGKSAAGLIILKSKRKTASAMYHGLTNAVRHPRARLEEGLALASTGGVTSSIDSSDGLALSLHQLAQASNVGICLDAIPIAPEVESFSRTFGLSGVDLALYGGEEYELVLTVRPEKFSVLKKRVRSLLKVGLVVPANKGVTATRGGKLVRIRERGWEHFRRHSGHGDKVSNLTSITT